ncbi:MAG: signal peptidase I [Rickettsiales bacterium]|nr:signal peptidase I [Rickettsiales bacterium]
MFKKIWDTFCKYRKTIKELFVILLIAGTFRSVLYEPYVVPSRSMLPTLIEGDRIIISKFVYGISRYSFPFSPPIFKGRLFQFNKPQRGEVIVFEQDKQYVKRVIGLPGETIQMVHGNLYINGQRIEKESIDPFIYRDLERFPQYLEIFPNGYEHPMLDFDPYSEFDNTKQFKVPKNHYFVMGDNRDNSRDSRDPSGIGFVHEDSILGRVEIIFWSSPTLELYNVWGIASGFKWNRAFKKII